MYYKIDNNFIIKYKVILNYEQLEKIKDEVIKNCSIVSHVQYKSENPSLFAQKYSQVFQNYQEKRIKTENNSIIYDINYDQYNFDMLVHVIDNILNGNYAYIDYLYNMPSKDNTEIENLLIYKKELITKSQNNNFLKEQLLECTRKIAFLEERNKKHELALTYIPNIIENIKLEEVKRYAIDDIMAFMNFLNIDTIDIKKLNKKK